MSSTADTLQGNKVPEAAPEGPPSPEEGRHGRRSLLRVSAGILFSVLLVLLFAIFWVLGTQSGLRFSLAMADKLAPGLLQVEQADGRILGDLHLVGLRVRTPGLKADLGDFDLSWSPLSVLSGTLRISKLGVRGLDIATAPAEEEKDEPPPRALPQILSSLQPELVQALDGLQRQKGWHLELEQALVEDLGVGALDTDARFRIDRIALAASWLDGKLTLKEFSVAIPEPLVSAEAQGEAKLTGGDPSNLELDLGLNWSLSQEPALKLAGTAKIGGDLEALRLEHDLTGTAEIGLEVVVRDILTDLRWNGKLSISGLDLPSILADLPPVDLTGDFVISGNPEAARIQGELTEDKSGALLTADGRLDLSDPQVRLDLEAAWEKLRWPLTGEPVAETRQGKLDADGTFEELSYRVSAEVWGRDFPEAAVQLTGEGDWETARIRSLHIETLDGIIEAEGRVAWAPELSWDLSLSASGIDPGKQWSEWAGDLGGRILSKGTWHAGSLDLSAQVEFLKGRLRGYPVAAEARAKMKGEEIQLEQLLVSSGPSSLKAEGTLDIGGELDMGFALDSPDLRSLLPDARGSIKAKVSASGPFLTPAVKLELAAADLDYAGNGIQSLSGKADVDLEAGPIEIDLGGQGLRAGAMTFDSLRLQGNGETGSHQLSLNVTGKPLSLDLKATGGLKENNAYAGQLQGMKLSTQEFGNWRLEKAAELYFEGTQVRAGPLCVREDAGSGGCVDVEQSETGSWNLSLDLDRLAFGLFKDFVPEGFALEGEAQAKANFKASGGVLTGEAKVQVPSGVLSAASSGKPQKLLDFTSASLVIDAGAKRPQAKLTLPLAGLGDLSADIALPGWSLADPARSDQPIAGRVQARLDDLSLVSDFVPDITSLTGHIDADVKLGGSWSKQDVRGFVRLADGGLKVPFIGLEIRDLELSADARGDRLDYRSGLTAGKGRLEISGQTLLTSQGPVTEIRAKGDRLTLADSKEYFVLATADVEAKIEPTGTHLTGTLTLPEARISPRNIPEGSVSPSPDVVIASQAQKEPSRYSTAIDLDLVLGKQVKVDAFGLAGSIEGRLAVLRAPGKKILGDGELKVVDGTYRISTGSALTAAIGKPLTIEQGILSYAKSPIDNPFLILTAQREGGDISAGLRIFGPIKNPKMTFFSASDPGLTQSEITTYLLTGVPPKRGAENEQLGLSVGTYIRPKLFAEYENSLGDESDKIKLRYELNDWIELQTETGDSQGGDIFLKFEN